jgi:4-hydroxy-2-oxoheptanedioate aldolase
VVSVPGVALAEVTAGPVDFIWIDLEHGALGARDVQPLAIAARAARTAALARLPDGDPPDLEAVLDAGVDGVVAPRIETADAAAHVVDRLHSPPRGSRGFAIRRASGYGRADGPVPIPVCIVQIESTAGVRNAADIAAVDGVDALVVGCADLSLALGAPEGARSPAVRAAIEDVQLAAAAAGIPSGIAGPDDPALLAELGGGRSCVYVLSADVRLYARAIDSGVAALRREVGSRAPEPVEADVRA